MNIDLKARVRNKTFWIALISAIVLLIQQLGFKDLIPANYSDIVNSVLSILVMLGIIIDPSTQGISDGPVSSKLKVSLDGSEVTKAVQETINTYTQPTKSNVVDDTLASSKLLVDNPDNIQAIGQEVNHVSANMPQ